MVHYRGSCFLSAALHLIYNICGELSRRFTLASLFISTPVTFTVRHTMIVGFRGFCSPVLFIVVIVIWLMYACIHTRGPGSERLELTVVVCIVPWGGRKMAVLMEMNI